MFAVLRRCEARAAAEVARQIVRIFDGQRDLATLRCNRRVQAHLHARVGDDVAGPGGLATLFHRHRGDAIPVGMSPRHLVTGEVPARIVRIAVLLHLEPEYVERVGTVVRVMDGRLADHRVPDGVQRGGQVVIRAVLPEQWTRHAAARTIGVGGLRIREWGEGLAWVEASRRGAERPRQGKGGKRQAGYGFHRRHSGDDPGA